MSDSAARYDVVVIGGGSSGLMTAYFAAARRLKTLVVDKGDRLAKKLRITGKGRCNLTNNCDAGVFLSNVRRGGKFLTSSVSRFSSADIMEFFETRGLPLITERGNRVFPKNGDANDVAETLIAAARDAGTVFLRGRVVEIQQLNSTVASVILETGKRIDCSAAVIATGGLSYPKTGSTGDGYFMAGELSHTINTPSASLVPIICDTDDTWPVGLSLRNSRLVAVKAGKQLFSEQGEMLFTHFGVSGPLILSLSSYLAGENLKEITVYVDLKPALGETELDNRILRDFSDNINKDFKNSLDKLLPKKIIPAVINRSRIKQTRKINSVTVKERAALAKAIKHFDIAITGFRPVTEAVITAGGVELSEVDPKTMMSKKVKNLHFAGEVLDIDGYTGGFNLSIAFATGAAAGEWVLR